MLTPHPATSLISAFIVGKLAPDLSSSFQAYRLLAGSLFYKLPLNTSGLFTRGGVLFISILGAHFFFHRTTSPVANMAAAVPTLISMAETTRSFQGRGVLAKHKAYSMYRVRQISVCEQLVDSALKSLAQASSVIVAQTIADVRLSLRHRFGTVNTSLSLSSSPCSSLSSLPTLSSSTSYVTAPHKVAGSRQCLTAALGFADGRRRFLHLLSHHLHEHARYDGSLPPHRIAFRRVQCGLGR